MGKIIFDMLIILADGWVIFSKNSPKSLKTLALISMMLLVISIVTGELCK